MNERWLPVLAAILGVLGGVAGAAVGGYVANQGQERRLEAERASRMLDRRINAYVELLRAAENESDEATAFPDPIVESAAAEVELVARTEALREAARGLLYWTTHFDDKNDYRQARKKFIDVANADAGAEG